MKTLITADLHLNDNPRDAYRHKFMRWFLDLAKKHKVDRIIVAGDLCDEKDRHPAVLVNQVVDYFYQLAEVCPVTVLKGNHDYLDPEHAFYGFLRRIENVSWINNPTVEDVGNKSHDLFLLHTTNYKHDWKGLNFKTPSYIFCHQTFNGAAVGFGRHLDGIPLDIFPKNVRVISGDIHVPQQLGPVTYVGAPYTVDFGDQYQPRVLLIDGDKIKSIPVDGPQKRLVEAEAGKHIPEINTDLNKGDIIKFRIGVKNVDQWPEIKAEIKAWCEKHGFIPHAIQPVLRRDETGIKSTKAKASNKSDEQILREYALRRDLDKNLLSTGLFLLDKV